MDKFAKVEFIEQLTIQELETEQAKAPESFDLWDYLTRLKAAVCLQILGSHITGSANNEKVI